MQKWEYRKEENLGESGLNELGAEGWELIAVTSTANGSSVYFYFKREKLF